MKNFIYLIVAIFMLACGQSQNTNKNADADKLDGTIKQNETTNEKSNTPKVEEFVELTGTPAVVSTKTFEHDDNLQNPVFMPDNKTIIATSEGYKGLYKISSENGDIEILNQGMGAGYCPVASTDVQNIYYRRQEFVNKRKTYTILRQNLSTKESSVIVEPRRSISVLFKLKHGVACMVDGTLKTIEGTLQKDEYFTMIENRKLVLVGNNVNRTIAPIGEGHYLWPSISPDGKHVLFVNGAKGATVCDLNGEGLIELGMLNAPKWVNNNWIVGMKDEDDGHKVTASDIFMVSADGKKTIQLTETKDVFEMFPSASPEQKSIACSTEDGKIVLIELAYNEI